MKEKDKCDCISELSHMYGGSVEVVKVNVTLNIFLPLRFLRRILQLPRTEVT